MKYQTDNLRLLVSVQYWKGLQEIVYLSTMLVTAPVNVLLGFLWRTVTLEDCDLLACPLSWPLVEPTFAEPFR